MLLAVLCSDTTAWSHCLDVGINTFTSTKRTFLNVLTDAKT